MSTDLNWGREPLSLGIGLALLIWGFVQPFLCAYADTRGTGAVIGLGGFVYTAALSVLACAGYVGVSREITVFIMGVGQGTGSAATSTSVVFSLLAKTVVANIAAVAGSEIGFEGVSRVRLILFGCVSAASQMGQFVMAPMIEAIIASNGWRTALWVLTGFAGFIIPLAFVLREQVFVKMSTPAQVARKTVEEPVVVVDEENAVDADSAKVLSSGKPSAESDRDSEVTLHESNEPATLSLAIKEALTSTPFIMITCAFFVCGWHIGFIGTHLPSFASDNGVNQATASWTLSLIGLTSTIGTASAGLLPRWLRLRVKFVLALLYWGRAILITIFLVTIHLNPSVSVMTFSFLVGFLWLTTVPCTAGLVSDIYGSKYLGTLSAITFTSHQIGSFLGSWLGGLEYDTTGSTILCWWVSVGLAVVSGAVHCMIKDDPIRRVANSGNTDLKAENGTAK
ncbi:hypothetical protein HDU76_009434 [Blyttiomyces sp. JEL0837]|nr:hypothetical protein HDU76_009434 [Blyttiomyces sp. JEL0837]